MKLIYKFTVNQLPPGFAVGTVQNVIFKQLPPPPPPYTGGELITKQFLPLCKGELVGVVGNYKICNFTPNERLRMSHVLTYLFVALLMT